MLASSSAPFFAIFATWWARVCLLGLVSGPSTRLYLPLDGYDALGSTIRPWSACATCPPRIGAWDVLIADFWPCWSFILTATMAASLLVCAVERRLSGQGCCVRCSGVPTHSSAAPGPPRRAPDAARQASECRVTISRCPRVAPRRGHRRHATSPHVLPAQRRWRRPVP